MAARIRVQFLSGYVVRMPSDGVSGCPVWVYFLHGFQRTLLNLGLLWWSKRLSKHQNLTHFLSELIARVLNMSIELKGDNYYSKVFKRVNYELWNNTFWIVINYPLSLPFQFTILYIYIYKGGKNLRNPTRTLLKNFLNFWMVFNLIWKYWLEFFHKKSFTLSQFPNP